MNISEPRLVSASSGEPDLIPVTAVIPVKDEERSLPSCLAALDGFAGVVVVDSGSTDATVAIAQEAGVNVIQFRWSGGFPKKRNWVLQTFPFRTRWVLFIDADEIVTPAFKAELRAVLN
jgi:glycosyltransferase involved in cell wall biosynthesis